MIARREQYVTYLLLGVFSIIALVPIVGIVITALQEQGSLSSFGVPAGIHPGNFADAWREGNFSSYLVSSAIVVVAVVTLSTLFSVMAGYAFGMMRFRGQTVLFYVLLLGLMVPLEATIVPLYYDLRDLGLTDTYWSLIWPQVGRFRGVRDVLDARVLPVRAALAGGGGAPRRLLQLAHAVARGAAARRARRS